MLVKKEVARNNTCTTKTKLRFNGLFTFILAQLHMSIKREKHQPEDGLFVDVVLIYLSPVIIILNTEYSDSRSICLAYPQEEAELDSKSES